VKGGNQGDKLGGKRARECETEAGEKVGARELGKGIMCRQVEVTRDTWRRKLERGISDLCLSSLDWGTLISSVKQGKKKKQRATV